MISSGKIKKKVTVQTNSAQSPMHVERTNPRSRHRASAHVSAFCLVHVDPVPAVRPLSPFGFPRYLLSVFFFFEASLSFCLHQNQLFQQLGRSVCAPRATEFPSIEEHVHDA